MFKSCVAEQGMGLSFMATALGVEKRRENPRTCRFRLFRREVKQNKFCIYNYYGNVGNLFFQMAEL